jgi:4-diphosphocytidyl-2-C-methyl-D-erythritol kinase
MSLALRIGADVPFFLIGGRAKGEGYGERINPLEDGPCQSFVVAKPAIGCSTPQMYRMLDEHPRPWREFPVNDELFNDFNYVAPPECRNLMDRLLSLDALDASLTGSGSAVFARFENQTIALSALELLEAEGPYFGWVCTALERHKSLRLDVSIT